MAQVPIEETPFDRREMVADAPPTAGTHNRGDLIWNRSPAPGEYVGWVCVATGTPGDWAPFGPIWIGE